MLKRTNNDSATGSNRRAIAETSGDVHRQSEDRGKAEIRDENSGNNYSQIGVHYPMPLTPLLDTSSSGYGSSTTDGEVRLKGISIVNGGVSGVYTGRPTFEGTLYAPRPFGFVGRNPTRARSA